MQVPILLTDFLTPVVVLTLLIASSRRSKPQPRSPDSDALDAEIEVARDAMRSYREALDRFVKG